MSSITPENTEKLIWRLHNIEKWSLYFFFPEKATLNFNLLHSPVQTCCSFPRGSSLRMFDKNMQHRPVLTKNQLSVLVKKKKIQCNTQKHVSTGNMEALQEVLNTESPLSVYKGWVWNLVSISIGRNKRHAGIGLFVSKGSGECCRCAWEGDIEWEHCESAFYSRHYRCASSANCCLCTPETPFVQSAIWTVSELLKIRRWKESFQGWRNEITTVVK